MNTFEQSEILTQMEDIVDLTTINNWPLAIGWWLLIAIATLIAVVGLVYYLRLRKYKASWYYDLYSRLKVLEQNLAQHTVKAASAEFSKLLRIIAVKEFSRASCASIVGYEWLAWLEENDPKQFPWVDRGKILISTPYTAENDGEMVSDNDSTVIKELIAAAQEWVKR